MSRARTRRTAAEPRGELVEPLSAWPRYCRGLDILTDADVRVGHHMAVGPAHLIEAGGHVALVRPSGDILKVYDTAGDCRGVFASWAAARATVLGLVAEWEAGVDLTEA